MLGGGFGRRGQGKLFTLSHNFQVQNVNIMSNILSKKYTLPTFRLVLIIAPFELNTLIITVCVYCIMYMYFAISICCSNLNFSATRNQASILKEKTGCTVQHLESGPVLFWMRDSFIWKNGNIRLSAMFRNVLGWSKKIKKNILFQTYIVNMETIWPPTNIYRRAPPSSRRIERLENWQVSDFQKLCELHWFVSYAVMCPMSYAKPKWATLYQYLDFSTSLVKFRRRRCLTSKSSFFYI